MALTTGLVTRLLNLFRTKAGALSLAGSVAYSVLGQTVYSGVLSIAGIVRRLLVAARTKAGALSLAGSSLRRIVAARAKAGVISLAGQATGVKAGIVTGTSKTVSGVLGLMGRISAMDIRLNRLSDAVLTFTGVARRVVASFGHIYQGTLTFAGSITKKRNSKRSNAGTLTISGDVTPGMDGAWHYSMMGILSLVGSVARSFFMADRSLVGGFTPQGALTKIKEFTRQKTGAISFAGTVTGLYTSRDILLGYLTLSGVVTKVLNVLTRKTLSSSLGLSGSVTIVSHAFARDTSGNLSFSGEQDAYKDVLYYGTEVY